MTEEEQKPKKLEYTAEQRALMEAIKFTLNTQGWKEVVIPNLALALSQKADLLSNPGLGSDIQVHFVRGEMSALKWVGAAFAQMIAEFDKAQAEPKEDASELTGFEPEKQEASSS